MYVCSFTNFAEVFIWGIIIGVGIGFAILFGMAYFYGWLRREKK
jgi:hypothetical protein